MVHFFFEVDIHASHLAKVQCCCTIDCTPVVKLETIQSASVSPEGSPTPKPRSDFLSEQTKQFIFEMSKQSSGSAGVQQSSDASDVLYVCSTTGFSASSFSTVSKAQAAITDFIIQLSNLDNVPRQLYDELTDLLVNLKTRNLRWSSLRFQLMTLPKNNGEVIALQSQLSMCPELRPANKQTHFGPQNWRPRGNNQFNQSQGQGQHQNFRPPSRLPSNPNFQPHQ